MSYLPIYERAMIELTNVVNRRLNELSAISESDSDLNRNPHLRILQFIYTVKNDIRLHSFNNVVDLQELWDMIRSDEQVFDFVMGLTSELALRLAGNVAEDPLEDFGHLKNAIVKSYSLYHDQRRPRGSQSSAESVIDKDTRERLTSSSFLQGAMEQDSWLTVIFMLQTMELNETT